MCDLKVLEEQVKLLLSGYQVPVKHIGLSLQLTSSTRPGAVIYQPGTSRALNRNLGPSSDVQLKALGPTVM